jgi:cell division protease FtsH
MRKRKMPPHGEKEPMENLKDKLRSLFGLKDPQKKKNALPPKAHFSIWYFVMAFLLFSYLQQNFFSAKVETIPYSQFKQYITEGTLSKLNLWQKARADIPWQGVHPAQGLR